MSYQRILDEFQASAIPDALTLANVRWIEGDEAIEAMASEAIANVQKSTSFVGRAARQILDTYEFVRAGGWIAHAVNIDGTFDESVYFKPVQPRMGFRDGKLKLIKYETPKGGKATPLLPSVSWEVGLQCSVRFGVEHQYAERMERDQEGRSPSHDFTTHISGCPSSLPNSRSANCQQSQHAWSLSALPEIGRRRGRDETGSLLQAVRNSARSGDRQYGNLDSRGIEGSGSRPDPGFWQWWQSLNLPIAVCEGWKKALAVTAQGLPAIAVRGITQWQKKGSVELHDVINAFATQGRTVYIIFDQDSKPKTQRDVRRETLKLGKTLEGKGCKVLVPVWDTALGKGIDDVLVGKGDEAQPWFNDQIANAPSLNDYRKGGRLAAALAAIDRLNQLSFPVERDTEGEYLPELPPLKPGDIHAVLAATGSGKTVRVGADWAQPWNEQGGFTLVLSPLNSLGRQTATDWNYPHIHDYGTAKDEQQALWSDVSYRRGLVTCPDSLHRIPDWFWQKKILLILDEANQTINHMCEGNTLGSRWADILEIFGKAAKAAIQRGAIVLAEANLPDRAVQFIQTITGCPDAHVRVFRHKKQGIPWDCVMVTGHVSGFRYRLMESIRSGKKILFVTTSQREAKRLNKAIAKMVPDANVARIDSETNQEGAFNLFFTAPSQWLYTCNPDVLILSPSAKSGVSIEGGVPVEDAYFDQVWGYFPALATDSAMQLLGRFRPSVPRLIFCPPFILSSGDESLMNPRAIKRRSHLDMKNMAVIYGVDDLLSANENRAELFANIEIAVSNYLASARTVSGAQKSIARESLIKALEADGHHVAVEEVSKDSAIIDSWKQIQDEIWQEDAQSIATACVDPERHDVEWAYTTLNSIDATSENRSLAHKILWREEFPGVLFDDVDECYQALCHDYGAMRRGVLLQARAENLKATKESDQRSVESILKDKIRAFHKLPKTYCRAALIAHTGVLELLDGRPYSNSDPRAILVKKQALYAANEISYWLRLQIKPEQSPSAICNKLLKKLGLAAVAIARPGTRQDRRDLVYSVAGMDNSVRARLLEALRRKYSESVSAICNRGKTQSLQIVDTTSSQANTPSPTHGGAAAWRAGAIVRWGASLGDWVIVAVEGTIAKIRQVSEYASNRIVEASLDQLKAAS